MEVKNNSSVQNTNAANANKNSEDIDSLLKNSAPLLLNVSNDSEDEVDPDLVNQLNQSESARLGDLSRTVFSSVASSSSRGATGNIGATSTTGTNGTTSNPPSADPLNSIETLFISNLLFGDNFYFDYKAAGVNPDDGISSDEWAILNNNSEYVNAASQNPRKKTMTPAELDAFIKDLEKPGSKTNIAFNNLVNIMGKNKSGDVSLDNVTKLLKTLSAKLQAGDGNIDSATNHAGTSVHGVLDRGDLARLAGISGSGLKIDATDLAFTPKPLTFEEVEIDEDKLKQIEVVRNQLLNYLKPYLNTGLTKGIVKAIDGYIEDAIKNGKQTGSLDGETVEYYPDLGNLISAVAVYTTNYERPEGFFDQIETYFNSMMAINENNTTE